MKPSTTNTAKSCNLNLDALSALNDHIIDNLDYIKQQLEMSKFSPSHMTPLDMNVRGLDDCGTTACLIGWAATSTHPLLKPQQSVVDDLNWVEYYNRVFFGGLVYDYCVVGESGEWGDNPLYTFLFEDGWANDIDAALIRIEYVLTHHAIPEQFTPYSVGVFDM